MSFTDYQDNLLSDKGFDNYEGTWQAVDGIVRSSSEDFPLLQSRDIQATKDGKRLDRVLEDFRIAILAAANSGGGGLVEYGLKLVEKDDNKYLYLTIAGSTIGDGILLPQAGSGENLDNEINTQKEIVTQIENALEEKANNSGTGVGIVSIEKTSSEGLVDTYTITFTDESTSTFTVTNGKSAFDYAKDAGYTGTESSFVAQLTGTSMVGSWTFIDDPDLTTLPDESTAISFISNGTEYSAIKRGVVGPSNLSIYGMYYGDRAVYVNSPDENDGITHGWSNDAYKTITITKEPSDPSIAAWIKENAEMVGTPSKRLKTRSKRVVDAINELKDKIDEGGTSENTLLNIAVITDYPTTMSAIVTAIEEAGGDVTQTTFVSFTGYLSGLFAVKFQHYGGNKYKVECVDINNVTKIYNPETDNVIDVTATRIEDFLSYTVNSGGGTGVEQIKCIDTWASGVRELYADNGIYWSEGFELYNQPELTGDVIAYGDITHRIPIAPGNNITFEVDAENEVVKINAIGGSGGASLALPMIRFANFTKVENEDSGDAIYRFTVENMGGGTLQEGDKLQICCRRTFPNGKWKLRKMAEREITYDDIGQRFLKIEVNPDDERNHKWLFRNDRVGGGTKSSMYFRLKRVTAYGDDDRECNAIFSNVEEVKKTYLLVGSQPDPYSLRIK